jgi:hypothetical protein
MLYTLLNFEHYIVMVLIADAEWDSEIITDVLLVTQALSPSVALLANFSWPGTASHSDSWSLVVTVVVVVT